MNAVGILGSYISKGVYTVSGSFHPFGGAVDIVVVEQPDGSFKSSPWYVRFGKFQGVLKTKGKVVNIIVNGVEASFNMYLDHKGEAYFLREVDDEGESSSSSSASGDETDGKSQWEQDGRRILGSKSCNYGALTTIANDGIEKRKANEKIKMRQSSQRSRILGFVWGRKAMKEDTSVARVDSLERAEIAANLLEVKWSTNLSPQKFRKEETRRFSSNDTSYGKDEEKLKTDDVDNHILSNNTSLKAKDQVAETSTVGEPLKGAYEVKSEISSEIEQIAVKTGDRISAAGIISKNTSSSLEIHYLSNSDTYYAESFNEEHLLDETSIVTQGFTDPEDKNISKDIKSLMFSETSDSSIVTVDESMVQTHRTSHLVNGGSSIFSVHGEQVHVTEVHSEDTLTSVVSEDFELETGKLEAPRNGPQQINPCNTCVYEGYTVDKEEPLKYTNLHTQIVSTDQIPGSHKEVKSDTVCSTFSSDLQDEEGVDDSVTSQFQHSLNFVGHKVITKETSTLPSMNLVEQFLFSDFDVSETNVIRDMESDSQYCNDEEDYSLVYPGGMQEENRSSNRINETCPSDRRRIFKVRTTSPITIPQRHPISCKEVGHLAASLPNMQAGIGSPIEHEIYHSHSFPVDSKLKSLTWMKVREDGSSSKSSEDEILQVSLEQSKVEGSQVSVEVKSILPSPALGSPAEATVDPVGNWKLWPFSFKRSNLRKATRSAVDNYQSFDIDKASNGDIAMDGDAIIFKHKAKKKMVRSISPTSEHLTSLNLKEGSNMVTFTFSTAVLGRQQVDARIYLWKWNTRIVVSDVDGTITKSDVLGQFMPFVGMDWSQAGVAPLFSAIKENGYQLLFLSARAISQAYHTRQFLFNLKQDGKALPQGPVVISPDGLFPSLYREVIRRAPHEFKIACLERIRELFPPDCNPFYAGFGNRNTDEISYLKVGIPKGKIFIINPKGEVAVNHRVDTKSYTSLRTLVNGMFPPTSFEQEDFNSWNYWKLPPPYPMVDI